MPTAHEAEKIARGMELESGGRPSGVSFWKTQMAIKDHDTIAVFVSVKRRSGGQHCEPSYEWSVTEAIAAGGTIPLSFSIKRHLAVLIIEGNFVWDDAA